MRQDAKIFIANLDYKTTEEKLFEVFQPYGAITNLSLPIDRETGHRRGFAFITFETADQAKAALAMNNTVLDKRTIRVDIARPKTTQAGSSSSQQRRRPHQATHRDQVQEHNDFDGDDE